MAAPSGSVTAGSLSYDVLNHFTTEGENVYMYFVVLQHKSIPDYNDDARNDYPLIIEVADDVYVQGATNSLTREWSIQVDLPTLTPTENANKDGWTTTQTDTAYKTAYPSAHYPSADSSDRPHFSIIELAAYDAEVGSPPTFWSEIRSVEINETHDSAFESYVVENIERATAGSRVYRADQPCTSWHIMNMIADSYNKVTYETYTHTSIPVFGYK